MSDSLRDVVALTHAPHSIDMKVGARLAITRQCPGRVAPHRVDLALAVRSPTRCAIGAVVRVGVAEVDAPVAETAAQRPDERTVDPCVLVRDLSAASSDDVREHAAGRHFMVTPPTLYSNVRTGVAPMAPACAPVEVANARAPVMVRVVARRVRCCPSKAFPFW